METAKNTDLPDLLEHLGYSVWRVGSRYHTTKEMDSITILKVNELGASLEGAVFDVYADGKFITSVETNSSGEARVTGIQKEAYIEVVEKAAPAGHVLDRTSHGIHIDPYDPAIEDDPVLTVVNLSKPSLRIIKYDRLSKEKLPKGR